MTTTVDQITQRRRGVGLSERDTEPARDTDEDLRNGQRVGADGVDVLVTADLVEAELR